MGQEGHQADEDDGPHDEGQIFTPDGFKKGHASAGPGEDAFHDYAAVYGEDEAVDETGDDGEEGVTSCVVIADLLFRQTLGAGGHDVVFTDGLKHAVASQEHGAGEGDEGEGCDGEDHVLEDVEGEKADIGQGPDEGNGQCSREEDGEGHSPQAGAFGLPKQECHEESEGDEREGCDEHEAEDGVGGNVGISPHKRI